MTETTNITRRAQAYPNPVGILYTETGSDGTQPDPGTFLFNSAARPARRAVGRRGAHAILEVLALCGIAAELAAFTPGAALEEKLRTFRLVIDLAGCDNPNPALCPAELLERLAVPHSGASSAALRLVRDAAALRACMAGCGVEILPGEVAAPGQTRVEMPLPVVISPVRQAECAAGGRNTYWVAVDEAGLRARLEYVHRACKQAALVQAFLPGADVIVPVLHARGSPGDPTPLPAVGYDHLNGRCQRYLTHAAQWQAGWIDADCCFPHVLPARDPTERAALEHAAVRAFQAAGCRDYAWIYFRVVGGAPYVVAINPAPPVSWQDPVCQASAQAAGMNFNALVTTLFESALRRAV